MTFRLQPKARTDLREIGAYIAERNPHAAKRLVLKIRETFRILGETPGIGMARPELRPHIRTFPVAAYIIAYRPAKRGIEILRVLHGARDWRALL